MIYFFSDDDRDPQIEQQSYAMAKEAGINILSDKELTAAFIEYGEVLGALFTGVSGDTYSFDVAVSPQAQSKGIGSKLTNLGISLYDQDYADAGMKIELDAVNPQMIQMLKRRGFEVENQYGGHTLMTRVSAVKSPSERINRLAKELVVYQDGLPFEEDLSPSLAPFTIEEKEEPSPHVNWMSPHHQNDNLLPNASRNLRKP
jgi:GNAT superfamily N-acetyltransferase